MELGKRYADALRLKYEGQIKEAEANLALYFNSKSLSAIGEHSDLLTEYDKWISIYSDTKGKLETLNGLNHLYNSDELLK